MLSTKRAAVIGIDVYGSGIAPLKSAGADARAVAAALERDHGYGSLHLLLDGEATGAALLYAAGKGKRSFLPKPAETAPEMDWATVTLPIAVRR